MATKTKKAARTRNQGDVTVDRDELLDAMDRGCTVVVGGQKFRRGGNLPEDTDDSDVRGVVARDPDGRLTYAGMVDAIQRGESVQWEGSVISSLDKLPHPVDVARDDENKLRSYESELLARRRLLEADETALRDRRASIARQVGERGARANRTRTVKDDGGEVEQTDPNAGGGASGAGQGELTGQSAGA